MIDHEATERALDALIAKDRENAFIVRSYIIDLERRLMIATGAKFTLTHPGNATVQTHSR